MSWSGEFPSTGSPNVRREREIHHQHPPEKCNESYKISPLLFWLKASLFLFFKEMHLHKLMNLILRALRQFQGLIFNPTASDFNCFNWPLTNFNCYCWLFFLRSRFYCGVSFPFCILSHASLCLCCTLFCILGHLAFYCVLLKFALCLTRQHPKTTGLSLMLCFQRMNK